MRASRWASRAVISGSKPNRSAVSDERARELAADRLVARLHVGEVEVRQHVAEHRQEACSPPSASSRARDAARRGSASRSRRRPCRRGSARAAPASPAGRTRDPRPGRSRCRRCLRRARCGSPRPCRGSRGWQNQLVDEAGRPASSSRRSRVPSVEQSSTQMISVAHRRRAHAVEDGLDRVALVVDRDEHRQAHRGRGRAA